mmetsp:Transcript_3889/g.9807  ORF Transcript_3889/g.9807 Transcript_3889/m.9807 type:complete len:345 (-) Transcript_3889:119-1153(-)
MQHPCPPSRTPPPPSLVFLSIPLTLLLPVLLSAIAISSSSTSGGRKFLDVFLLVCFDQVVHQFLLLRHELVDVLVALLHPLFVCSLRLLGRGEVLFDLHQVLQDLHGLRVLLWLILHLRLRLGLLLRLGLWWTTTFLRSGLAFGTRTLRSAVHAYVNIISVTMFSLSRHRSCTKARIGFKLPDFPPFPRICFPLAMAQWKTILLGCEKTDRGRNGEEITLVTPTDPHDRRFQFRKGGNQQFTWRDFEKLARDSKFAPHTTERPSNPIKVVKIGYEKNNKGGPGDPVELRICIDRHSNWEFAEEVVNGWGDLLKMLRAGTLYYEGQYRNGHLIEAGKHTQIYKCT